MTSQTSEGPTEGYRRTRDAVHAVVELLLAGPQHAESGTLRLRAGAGGPATIREPRVAVLADRLVGPAGEAPLDGLSVADLGRAVGVVPRSLDGVYADTTGADPEAVLQVDAGHLLTLVGALSAGDQALRRFATGETPVLWPEHLDVAVSLGEVNYGVSAGDGFHATPYAYVGPWEASRAHGPFWNAPFGAARPAAGLSPADLFDFFAEGRTLLRGPAVP